MAMCSQTSHYFGNRLKKITAEYLGVVKPEGIIPPKHKQSRTISGIQEAGNIVFIERFTKQLDKSLQKFWPISWQSILTAAIIKLVYREPLKRLQFSYKTSYTILLWPDAHLSKNSVTQLLEKLGTEWKLQRSFFENISKATSYMAIDLTRKKMLNNYSIHDVLWELSKVYVVKMDEKTVIGEVPKSARKIIEKLEIPITKELGS